MAEENQKKSYETTSEVEINDRGVFDFFGKKKEEKPQEEVIVTEFDQKVNVSGEPETKVDEKKEKEHGEEKKHTLLEKLQRSDSSSSSSSDEEEVGEDGEKKKKKKEKKGLKEKIQEKIGSHDDDKEEKKHGDTAVPVEKVEVDPEHQKGFLDKIKEKLPGQHKKTEEGVVLPTSSTEYGGHANTETSAAVAHEGEAKEKKGILEKIKENLPGYHPKTDEEKKEKERGAH